MTKQTKTNSKAIIPPRRKLTEAERGELMDRIMKSAISVETNIPEADENEISMVDVNGKKIYYILTDQKAPKKK